MGIDSLAFFVTERCQYSCEYCDIPHIKDPKDYDIVTFLRYINMINEYPLDHITITGGEPGLLSPQRLGILFDNIKHDIIINTNGEFIARGYYKRWEDQISMIDYHVTNVGQFFLYDIDTSQKDDCGFPKGRYNLVAHRENQEFIELIEMEYPNIDFHIHPYDDKLNEPRFRTGYKSPYIECYRAVKEIDFVNSKLVDCCSSPIAAPKDELTERNLKMFLEVKYARRWHCCETCQR